MDAGQLDVLHDRRHEDVGSVGDGVRFGLNGVFEELVDQDGPLRRDLHRPRHVVAEHLLVVDDFHRPAAQDIGGPDHQRIADPLGDLVRLFETAGHAGLRLRNPELADRHAEAVAVLGQVDGLAARSR